MGLSPKFTDEFLTNSHLLVLPGRAAAFPMIEATTKSIVSGHGHGPACSPDRRCQCREPAAGPVSGPHARVLAALLPWREHGGIVRQLLLEGSLIGIAGGAIGALFAPAAIQMLVRELDGDKPYGAFTTSVDTRLLLFNFAIALGVSILFSLAPLLQLRRSDLTLSMRQQAGTGSGAMLSFRRAVVCLQVGLSVLLLIAAGLFVRTMQNLRHVNVGFNTAHLLTFGINPKFAGYTPASVPALHQRVIDMLSVLPGVESVAATDDPELAGRQQGGDVTVAGYSPAPNEDLNIEEPDVNPAYFSTMQVPLLAGRYFTDGDTKDHPNVAIVNESFAKHFCGSARSCVGRLMSTNGTGQAQLDTQIVGVVRDAKHDGVRQAVAPTCFLPLKQDSNPGMLYLYVRTFANPSQMLATVRRAMQQLDPALALVDLRTMGEQIDDDLSNERMVSLLAFSFGILATLLAGIGLYGVLAYSTTQRTREIGIRIALGSTRLAVSRIILGDVLRLAGIGILAALPVAYGLSHLLRSQLFGVSPVDPAHHSHGCAPHRSNGSNRRTDPRSARRLCQSY